MALRSPPGKTSCAKKHGSGTAELENVPTQSSLTGMVKLGGGPTPAKAPSHQAMPKARAVPTAAVRILWLHELIIPSPKQRAQADAYSVPCTEHFDFVGLMPYAPRT